MSIKVGFDTAHNPEVPTIVLAKRGGEILGKIDAVEIQTKDCLNDASEISFVVYKNVDGNDNHIWDKITDFKLVYCVEWNAWFEIMVELDESSNVKKTVTGTSLGHAELSQIMLYDVEINTEDDIARDEYVETVLYEPENTKGSLLHRMLEKAPHYSIEHVDDTIARIQRTFSFDDKSIYDALQEVAEEIDCLFVINAYSDPSDETRLSVPTQSQSSDVDDESDYGAVTYDQLFDKGYVNRLIARKGFSDRIKRTISVYDLESNCLDCGHRGEFTGTCPKCGSTDIDEGYGEDTGIFVTSDELAEDIQLKTDTDEVKNCFKLEAGDDLMTATIRNCNPNGTDYIWNITDVTKEDMSEELVGKIEAYDKLYAEYQNDHVFIDKGYNKGNNLVSAYNKIYDKYQDYLKIGDNSDLNDGVIRVGVPVTGYPQLMNVWYNTTDMSYFLESSLMPIVELQDTTVETEINKINNGLAPDGNGNPYRVLVEEKSFDNISVSTADSVVLSVVKTLADYSRFKIKVSDKSSTLVKDGGKKLWIGTFDVINYSDEDDKGVTGAITVEIAEGVGDDYAAFVKQKIDKTLSKDDSDDMSITGLFKKDIYPKQSTDAFREELKKYSLNRLKSFHDACQSCIDILVEQGIPEKATWNEKLYDELYQPYLYRQGYINDEMKTRESEISIVNELQTYVDELKAKTNENLEFQDYIGDSLLAEFCSFKREDKYSNDNYVSDGLGNSEIFKKALEFIEVATKEIHKSSELKRSISANLYNLLAIKKFEPLVDWFKVGNWIRVMVDSKVYKLRLIEYSIDYDDLTKIDVEFSDVTTVKDSFSDIKSVLDQASSMATSYTSVKRQAKQGSKSENQISKWFENGIPTSDLSIVTGADDQSIVWDKHGILCRKYDSDMNEYSDEQLKIFNKGLYITDDNWKTSKSAIGSFSYYDPKANETKTGYGVIADTIIGSLMLAKEMGIYNDDGSVSIDNDGITIITESGEEKSLFSIKRKTKDTAGKDVLTDLMHVNSSGNLVLDSGRLIFSSDVSDVKDLNMDEVTSRLDTATKTANHANTVAEDVNTKMSKVNQAATATISSGKTHSLTTSRANVPLGSITQKDSAYSLSSNGIKVPYDGTYEVSGYVSVTGLVAGQDVSIGMVNGSTVIRNATSTSAGSDITVSLPPSVVKLSANNVVCLTAYSTSTQVSTSNGTISDQSNAALTVRFLG